MQSAYLFFRIDRFSFKLKEFLAPKKIYCIDMGLINAIGSKISKNTGKLMGNPVAIELMKRKYRRSLELFYYKDHQQYEDNKKNHLQTCMGVAYEKMNVIQFVFDCK